MKDIYFSISKATAWEEAQKNSEYVGAKLISETDIFDSVAISEDDMNTLDRFFLEACSVADNALKELKPTRSDDYPDDYHIRLTVANGYDNRLDASVNQALLSFFANFLTAKWLKFSNAQEADKYAQEAEGYLNSAASMLWSRQRPRRPAPEVV